jgi:hypothetical protein
VTARSFSQVIAAAGLMACVWSPASAQTQPIPRRDVSATIGWLDAKAEDAGFLSYNRWESSLYGSAGAGWYWTDHLKTEVDFGAGTKGDVYLSSPLVINGVPGQSIERQFSRRILGLSQQYQFFRNAWFHPYLAAGANLTWERRTDRFSPLFVYDQGTRTSRQVLPERFEGPRTEFDVRPFVGAGFKTYMTRRAFFRSDLRVGFKNGVDETLLRFGFGADF